MNVLGERIKQLRKDRKMTQEDLAKVLRDDYNLNVDRVMISKWETGFQIPRIHNIMCIANFFDVSVDFLTRKSSSTKPVNEQLFELFNSLNNENKSKIIELLHFYIEHQEKQWYPFLFF